MRRSSPARNIKYLTPEELKRLLGVIESPRDRAIFRLAYHRGLRAGEVALLQMEDWRPGVGRLYVHRLKCRKVDTSGEYALTDAEIKTLKAWIKERGDGAGAIFCSNRGTGISQQMLDVLMKRYCGLAGIDAARAHFHTLRHTCATHLISRESVELVQDHLGHVSIANTMIYAKITNQTRDAAAKRLKEWK